ncbi:MAG: dihydrodipicolinate synthase family protein [Chloroflexota bacterium]
MNTTFRGYYAIAMTPFSETGELLWNELAREFDWIARAGAHGVVWPVNNSEFYTLSEGERARGFKVMVDAVGGRIPTVAGTADTSTGAAALLTRAAAQAGCDAVIAMPPWSVHMTDPALVKHFYRAVAEAAGVPVFIQNLAGWVGSNLSTSLVLELCREIPLVDYVKEERDPHGVYVSEIIDAHDPAVKGVFTGGHKLGMVATHQRGAVGCIASADMSDLCGQIWDLMEAGDVAAARRLQDVEAVVSKACGDLPYLAGRKEIMRRRGIFSTTAQRSTGVARLDPSYVAELDHALELIAPYMRG